MFDIFVEFISRLLKRNKRENDIKVTLGSSKGVSLSSLLSVVVGPYRLSWIKVTSLRKIQIPLVTTLENSKEIYFYLKRRKTKTLNSLIFYFRTNCFFTFRCISLKRQLPPIKGRVSRQWIWIIDPPRARRLTIDRDRHTRHPFLLQKPPSSRRFSQGGYVPIRRFISSLMHPAGRCCSQGKDQHFFASERCVRDARLLCARVTDEPSTNYLLYVPCNTNVLITCIYIYPWKMTAYLASRAQKDRWSVVFRKRVEENAIGEEELYLYTEFRSLERNFCQCPDSSVISYTDIQILFLFHQVASLLSL